MRRFSIHRPRQAYLPRPRDLLQPDLDLIPPARLAECVGPPMHWIGPTDSNGDAIDELLSAARLARGRS